MPTTTQPQHLRILHSLAPWLPLSHMHKYTQESLCECESMRQGICLYENVFSIYICTYTTRRRVYESAGERCQQQPKPTQLRFYTRFLSIALSLSLCLSLSHTHTGTCVRVHEDALPLTPTPTLSRYLLLTHTHTYTQEHV